QLGFGHAAVGGKAAGAAEGVDVKIVYVALGPHRVLAAAEHAARLVSAGAAVELIVPDSPAWAGLAVPGAATITVVRHSDALGEASRALTGRTSPLRDADELIAGDLQAVPAVWAAARRFRRGPVPFVP